VSSAPPLLSSNCFSVLEIYDVPDLLQGETSDEDAQPIPHTETRKPCQPKLEQRLNRKLIICSLDKGPNCIMLPIHLKMTNTLEEAVTEAMVNTSTTGVFINRDFIEQAKLPTHQLSQLIPVYSMDGTPNEAGSINKVIDVVMTYDGHSECILLAVT